MSDSELYFLRSQILEQEKLIAVLQTENRELLIQLRNTQSTSHKLSSSNSNLLSAYKKMLSEFDRFSVDWKKFYDYNISELRLQYQTIVSSRCRLWGETDPGLNPKINSLLGELNRMTASLYSYPNTSSYISTRTSIENFVKSSTNNIENDPFPSSSSPILRRSDSNNLNFTYLTHTHSSVFQPNNTPTTHHNNKTKSQTNISRPASAGRMRPNRSSNDSAHGRSSFISKAPLHYPKNGQMCDRCHDHGHHGHSHYYDDTNTTF